MSPRLEFSFDLAFHRSKEKKRKDSLDDAAFAAMVDETAGSSERPARSGSLSGRAASFFRSKSRERSDSKDYSSSLQGHLDHQLGTLPPEVPQLAMKEAREKEPQKKKMTYAERRRPRSGRASIAKAGRRSGGVMIASIGIYQGRGCPLGAAGASAPRRAVGAQPRRTAPPRPAKS